MKMDIGSNPKDISFDRIFSIVMAIHIVDNTIKKRGFSFNFKSQLTVFIYSIGVFPPKSRNEDVFLFSAYN